LLEELTAALADTGDEEETLDAARRWANEQKFRVGVHTLRNLMDPAETAPHLADIADAALLALQPRIEELFAGQHGRLPGDGLAVIAMGKMGSREMTAASDLDLILVYDVADGADASDGPKPLAPAAYYARLTQRLINALTAKTAEGTLYEVDMRLRPSGNAGPIATSLAAFTQYQETMAWTWEHMALTRARLVTGADLLRAAVRRTIDEALRRRRDPDRLVFDVADMRRRIAREHKAENGWNVKHRQGGLVDIEFIAQYLQLRWAHEHPSILSTSTAEALERAGRIGLIGAADVDCLLDALRLWSAIQQVLRQTVEGSFSEETSPGRLKQVLARATGSTHFQNLIVRMDRRASQVVTLYQRLIEEPAGRVGPADKETHP
jgi:glutamate-ammonia-ligase adenylyltransferase